MRSYINALQDEIKFAHPDKGYECDSSGLMINHVMDPGPALAKLFQINNYPLSDLLMHVKHPGITSKKKLQSCKFSTPAGYWGPDSGYGREAYKLSHLARLCTLTGAWSMNEAELLLGQSTPQAELICCVTGKKEYTFYLNARPKGTELSHSSEARSISNVGKDVFFYYNPVVEFNAGYCLVADLESRTLRRMKPWVIAGKQEAKAFWFAYGMLYRLADINRAL